MELDLLVRHGVDLGPSGLTFAKRLSEGEMRTVFRIIAALYHRTNDEENHINFALGDWYVQAEEWFGKEEVDKWIDNDQELRKLNHDLMHLTGVVLAQLQQLERTILGCCAFLQPRGLSLTVSDFMSGDPARLRQTLGQLTRALVNHALFDPGFESRLRALVEDRNRLAHRLWSDVYSTTDVDDLPTLVELKQVEGFLSNLLKDALEMQRVFFGLHCSIGIGAAAGQGLDPRLEPGVLQWAEYLPDFHAVMRRVASACSKDLQH